MPEFILEIGNSVERRNVEGPKIVLGRDPSCDLVIDNPSISRQHASVEKKGAQWVLKDLNSGNGVFVDDEKIRRVALGRGTQFSLGDVVTLTFIFHDEAATQEVASETQDVDEPQEENGEVHAAPTIPDYDVIDHLGDGPRFQSFSFRKRGSKNAVCIRAPKGEFGKDLESLVSDWNEIDHEGVARLDIVKDQDGKPLIRERLSHEGTLADFIREEGRIEISLALKISQSLARGVDALHDGGVRVGRLRPAKIRMSRDGSDVRISGPSVASIEPKKTSDEFATSLCCLAPEYFKEGAKPAASRPGDVFAFGAIIHHLFTGVSVGEGKTVEGVERSITRGLAKEPAERRKGLPEGLSDLLKACLAPDPRDRPLTMTDVVETLSGMNAAVAAKGPSRPIQAVERELGVRQGEPKKSIRHRTLSWSITIILLLLVNGLVVLLYKDRLTIFDDAEDQGPGFYSTDFAENGAAASLSEQIDRFAENDQFAAAAAKIKAALAAGEIDEKEAGSLQGQVDRRLARRLDKLSELIEKAIKRKKIADASSYLLTVEGLVGVDHETYKRLKAQLGGR